jgi:hypothetical protein
MRKRANLRISSNLERINVVDTMTDKELTNQEDEVPDVPAEEKLTIRMLVERIAATEAKLKKLEKKEEERDVYRPQQRVFHHESCLVSDIKPFCRRIPPCKVSVL